VGYHSSGQRRRERLGGMRVSASTRGVSSRCAGTRFTLVRIPIREKFGFTNYFAWREEPRAMQWPWPEDVPPERRPAIAQILRDAGYGPRSQIEFVYMRVPAGCAQVLTPVSVCWCFWSI
jgi:hypothetical protein